MTVLSAVGHALTLAGSMTWEILWALILGFALSAVVQAVVRHSTIVALMGDDRPRTLAVAAGHCFIVFVDNGYPVNILNAIKQVPEVCGIYCATANPVELVIAETELGRGIIGVIDGSPPLGVESDDDVADRKALLRTIGYKL